MVPQQMKKTVSAFWQKRLLFITLSLLKLYFLCAAHGEA